MSGMPESQDASRWSLIAEYHTATVAGAGAIRNVSEHGIFLEADTLPRVGDRVDVRVEFEPCEIAVCGVVLWSGDRADGVSGFQVDIMPPPSALIETLESAQRSLGGGSVRAAIRRVARRLPLSLPVVLQFQNILDDGFVVDISLSGARIKGLGLALEVGAEVTLTLVFEDRGTTHDVVGVVVRKLPLGAVAVRFEAASRALEAELEALEQRVAAIGAGH